VPAPGVAVAVAVPLASPVGFDCCTVYVYATPGVIVVSTKLVLLVVMPGSSTVFTPSDLATA